MGNRGSLSDLDRRVASGLKVVAAGAEAEAFTPKQLTARAYVGRAHCGCGHRGFLDHNKLVRQGRGDLPLGALKPKLVCSACGSKTLQVEVVNPYQDNLS